jgi:uncharacterized protein YaaN involved in tellurite resistance
MLHENATPIQEGASGATIDIEKLKEAFANVRAAIDGMAEYRIRALSSIRRRSIRSVPRSGKAKAYLETRREMTPLARP